jgi:hypothetical protein
VCSRGERGRSREIDFGPRVAKHLASGRFRSREIDLRPSGCQKSRGWEITGYRIWTMWSPKNPIILSGVGDHGRSNLGPKMSGVIGRTATGTHRGARLSQSARRKRQRVEIAARREAEHMGSQASSHSASGEEPLPQRGETSEVRRLLARLRAAIAARDVARSLLKGSGDRPDGGWILRRVNMAYDVAWGHSWRNSGQPRFPPETLEGHVHNAEVRLEAERQRLRRRWERGEGRGAGDGPGSG